MLSSIITKPKTCMSNFRILHNTFLSPLPHLMWKTTIFFSKIRKHRTSPHCRLEINFMRCINIMVCFNIANKHWPSMNCQLRGVSCHLLDNEQNSGKNILTFLKELRNCILCIICMWPLFYSVRNYIRLHFLPVLSIFCSLSYLLLYLSKLVLDDLLL